MKHKAYQIVNFKDPLSMRYFEHSQKSLKLIEDILEVEPIQCVTPEEVESYNFPFQDYGPKGENRSIYEKACYISHFNLIKKLAAGEKFLVLEHDVYVWPQDDRLSVLYTLMDNIDKFAAFYPGISNEFYTMDSAMAKFMILTMTEHNGDYGPLGAIREILRHFGTKENQIKEDSVVFPIATLDNRIGIGTNVLKIVRGEECQVLPAPITQHYILNQGSTIKTRNVKWKVTKKNNPNFYFTED